MRPVGPDVVEGSLLLIYPKVRILTSLELLRQCGILCISFMNAIIYINIYTLFAKFDQK